MQDFLKLDMGCREDASIHDGTVKASLERVRDGLNKTGRSILYYIDAGADSFPGCSHITRLPIKIFI
jgi:hypothetical protein